MNIDLTETWFTRVSIRKNSSNFESYNLNLLFTSPRYGAKLRIFFPFDAYSLAII